MSEEHKAAPIRIFYSYAQEDEGLYRELEKHLSLLRWYKKIVESSRYMIPPGMESTKTAEQNLLSASFIFLLISADFLSSSYCFSDDMRYALERHERGEAVVVPILVRPVDWERAPFASLQYLPRNNVPITRWADRDEAWKEVAGEIRRMVEGRLLKQNVDSVYGGRPPVPETNANKQLLYTYDIHSNTPLTVAWSPDGTRIASGGWDNTVHIYEAGSGQHLLTCRYPPHFLPNVVEVLRWSPDSKRLASGGAQMAAVYVWDASTGQNIMRYEGHSALLPGIWSLEWSPDGRYIASAGSAFLDALAHIWDANSGRSIRKMSRLSALKWDMPRHVAWSVDGTQIAVSSEKKIYIYDVQAGKELLHFSGHDEFIVDIVWPADGKWIVSAQPGKIMVWNGATGAVLLSYERHEGPIRRVAVSLDGKYVASASEDRTVHIWELLTGTQRFVYRGHSDHVTAVSWSPDGTRLASASRDKTVHVWRTLFS